MDPKEKKSLVRALAIIGGLDARRRREGELPPAPALALKEAEDLVSSVSGRKMLEAWRTWRDSGSHVRDPFAGDPIVRDELSPGARGGGRDLVAPLVNTRNCTPAPAWHKDR